MPLPLPTLGDGMRFIVRQRFFIRRGDISPVHTGWREGEARAWHREESFQLWGYLCPSLHEIPGAFDPVPVCVAPLPREPRQCSGRCWHEIWDSSLSRQSSVPAISLSNLLLAEAEGSHTHCCDLQ